MTRPRGVKVATALLCLFNVLGAAFFESPEGVSAAVRMGVAAAMVVAVAVSFVVTWFFWKGRNWARWLVMAMSVFTLLTLWPKGTEGPLLMAFLVAQALLAAWLLFWLNTRTARAFFGRGGRDDHASTAVQTEEQG